MGLKKKKTDVRGVEKANNFSFKDKFDAVAKSEKDNQQAVPQNDNQQEISKINLKQKSENNKNGSSHGLLFFAAGVGFTFILLLLFFVTLLWIAGLGSGDGNGAPSLFGQDIEENSFVVVPISGEIGSCEMCADAQKISKALLDLKDNKNVKAVILDINSPGGGVAETEVIIAAVKKLKQSKPIVSVISQQGASGAYFIAGASDRIFVYPHAIVGSLGVIMSYKYYQGLYEKLGINVSVFKSGEMKDMGSEYRSPTSEEQQRFQTIVSTLYKDLLNEFTVNRTISSENLESIKTGSIFLGKEAVSFGLADEIGGQDQAVDYLSNHLNITEPRINNYNINKEKGLFNMENIGRAMGEGIAKQILTQQEQTNIKSQYA